MLAVFNNRSLIGNEFEDESSQKISRLLAEWKIKAVKKAQQKEKDDTIELLQALRTSLVEQSVPVKELRETYLGNGRNGFAYLKTQRNDLVDVVSPLAGRFTVLFQGDLSSMTGIASLDLDERMSDVERIVKKYISASGVHNNFSGDSRSRKEFSETSVMRNHMQGLKGSYAFVLYDRKWERIIVMRDEEGAEPLYWGVADNCSRTGLVISTDQSLVLKATIRYCEFPKGSMYISHDKQITTGTLNGEEIDDPVRLTAPVKRRVKPEAQLLDGRLRRTTMDGHSFRPQTTGGYSGLPGKSRRHTFAASMMPSAKSCFPEGSAAALYTEKLEREGKLEPLLEPERRNSLDINQAKFNSGCSLLESAMDGSSTIVTNNYNVSIPQVK